MADRDPKTGVFLKGNPGGPGRPRAMTRFDYSDRAAERVTLERWDALVEKAYQQALEGDRYAREWLSSIVMLREPDGVENSNGRMVYTFRKEKAAPAATETPAPAKAG